MGEWAYNESRRKNDRSPAVKKPAQVAKYTAKDSLFTDLFRIPKYLLQLYQALHPEDQDVTEDNIRNVTIKNVLLDQSYNDVGFQIGEKLVVLVEQQSYWSINIVVRCLLYLVQTYQEYFESTKQNVYGSKRLELLKPEIYVIYSGDRQARPEYLSSREKEVVDIMMTLFNDEYILRTYVLSGS